MTDLKTLRQHHLLSKLLHLAREQGVALQTDRLDVFLDLMGERDDIVAELTDNADAPAPINVMIFPTAMLPGSEADLRAVNRALIASVLEQDDENEQILRTEMDRLVAALGRINQGYSVSKRYAATFGPADVGRRVDAAR